LELIFIYAIIILLDFLRRFLMSEIQDTISKLSPEEQEALEIFAERKTTETWNYYRDPEISTFHHLVNALFFLGFINDGINHNSSRRNEGKSI
jgi:hypothetical protein